MSHIDLRVIDPPEIKKYERIDPLSVDFLKFLHLTFKIFYSGQSMFLSGEQQV